MDKVKKVFLQVLIDPNVKQKFASKAEGDGKNMTDVVLELIGNYIDESKRIDNTEIIQRLEAVERFIKIKEPRVK
jgi:hypothetical protein